MKIIISNNLKIIDPTKEIKAWAFENLTLDNPDYYKKERIGKWTGNIPMTISLYECVGYDMRLPFGCLQNVWKLHPIKEDYSVAIHDQIHTEYQSRINLYPYQEKAVTAMINGKNGVLVMPCGSGKTQCGLEIIARIGGRALWLTHTQDLLNQSKQRAESVLEQGGYGTITAGKVNIGTHITFATVQTMSKLHLESYRDMWDVIIVDEAQHCAGSPTKVTQFYKVVSSLSARYKIGLTATPKRADGLERAMFALLGHKVYEVSRDDVAQNTCPVKILQVNTGWIPDPYEILQGDGTIDYMKVIDCMIHDDARFGIVIQYIVDIKQSMIVLANRVDYLQRLCQTAERYGKRCICLSGQGKSKKAKTERKIALEKLNNGELDCIFATYQLAKEGLDVPSLRYVVFATPEQDETTVVQSVGRVGRKADGKEYGTVIDFIDTFGMYQKWSKKRQGYYKKIDAEVIKDE